MKSSPDLEMKRSTVKFHQVLFIFGAFVVGFVLVATLLFPYFLDKKADSQPETEESSVARLERSPVIVSAPNGNEDWLAIRSELDTLRRENLRMRQEAAQHQKLLAQYNSQSDYLKSLEKRLTALSQPPAKPKIAEAQPKAKSTPKVSSKTQASSIRKVAELPRKKKKPKVIQISFDEENSYQ